MCRLGANLETQRDKIWYANLMKKIFIIVGIIFFTTNSFSSENTLSKIDFSKVDKTSDGPHVPYPSNPNLETLKYFLHLYNSYQATPGSAYIVEPSANPYEFKSDLLDYKFLNKEMEKKGLFSYLYFDKNHIVIDKISPKNRLGEFVNNKTKLRSNSVGKSMVSYVLAHAICNGYIESVDTRISDWDLMKGTLYENHKLIDLLNMTSGDHKYVYSSHLLKNGKPSRDDGLEISNWTPNFVKDYFTGKKNAKKKYNYTSVNTRLILQYIFFKSKGDFQKILNKTFQEKSKIKNQVFFFRKANLHDQSEKDWPDPMFYATRLDYLRIAKAMMDDYQSNTCEGKYLKEIYKRKISKNINHDGEKKEPMFNRTKSYGGQFHLDYPGLNNRIVFGMGGFAGQAILIDMENSRIVVINSIHYNNGRYKYDVKKLLINPIKKGEKAFK